MIYLLSINNNFLSMKPPSSLKTIVDISYIILLIKWIIGLLIFTDILFGGRVKLFAGYISESFSMAESKTATIIFFAIQLLVSALFIYAVYLIRRLIKNFNTGKLYTNYQISGLKLTGQLIIVVTVVNGLLEFLYEALFKNHFGISLNFENGFGSFWFVIAIGLFFIYLSRIFANARQLREENELTV